MFGTEGPGLSPETDALLDRRVTIPMTGGVDSLNVASAAAVAFYMTRQNRLCRVGFQLAQIARPGGGDGTEAGCYSDRGEVPPVRALVLALAMSGIMGS